MRRGQFGVSLAAAFLGALLGWAASQLWGPQPAAESGPPYHPIVSFGSQYAKLMQHYQRTADTQQPAGAVIFLGDSHTQGLAVAAVAPLAVNYGVGGLNTEGLLSALPHLESIRRARAVVLMIGSNDLPAEDEDALEERLEEIATGIEVPLVWHAIPGNRRVPLEVTAATNQTIREICEDRPRCRYVETAFGPGDFQEDGSHLSPSGYRKWIASLRAAVTAS